MKQLKNDPVQRKIMQRKDAFVDNDDFELQDAIDDKRKFLIKRLKKNTLLLRTTMITVNNYIHVLRTFVIWNFLM